MRIGGISTFVLVVASILSSLGTIKACRPEIDDWGTSFEIARSFQGYVPEEVKEAEPSGYSFSLYLKTGERLFPDAFWGDDIYEHMYGCRGALKGQESTSRENVEVRILEGSAGKKACKILSTPASPFSFFSFIFECLSTLYIHTHMEFLGGSTTFRFASLEAVGMHYEKNKIKSLFMVSEFAAGRSIEDIFIDMLEKNDSQGFLKVMGRVAVAFAQLHEGTKGASTREKILFSYEETLEKANKFFIHFLYSYFIRPSAQKDLIMQEFTPFLEEIEKLYTQIRQEESEISARSTSVIHGDAHMKNIFHDDSTGRVTFIDFQTVIFSYKRDADPLKDVGCFLESLWLKLACMKNRSPQELYEMGTEARNIFVQQYIEHIEKGSLTEEKALRRVKYYMWSQLFDFFNSLDRLEYPQSTFSHLKYFLSQEFNLS